LKVAITEMYPRITWELAADTLGSAEDNLWTTGLFETPAPLSLKY